MLSEGRSKPQARPPIALGLVLSGVVVLAFVGGFVVVRALVEWML